MGGCGRVWVCDGLKEGRLLMPVSAVKAGLLFTLQLSEAIYFAWSFWWLGARTCMLKTSECC